ncbi:hypothetical protein BDB00DRAFT_928276 [Zychaea mexicana]|uniref:uncharacterized protein n=1 Tax=Zychaea mexicana TaxID=64656 RepID=UPI0022FDB2AF|nr:uncharacterized protein BDB00DRAFT_928276 [Zychaea mexicana]KAI9494358.1 hypothetical protein BDB00DRAFT_928276 [Zychaea mexicana]
MTSLNTAEASATTYPAYPTLKQSSKGYGVDIRYWPLTLSHPFHALSSKLFDASTASIMHSSSDARKTSMLEIRPPSAFGLADKGPSHPAPIAQRKLNVTSIVNRQYNTSSTTHQQDQRNSSLAKAELETPDHPESPNDPLLSKSEPSWIKKVKGHVEELAGIITQEGDLQGRGEQLKMDADAERKQ